MTFFLIFCEDAFRDRGAYKSHARIRAHDVQKKLEVRKRAGGHAELEGGAAYARKAEGLST